MCAQDGSGDRQSKPRPFRIAAPRGISAVKAIEQVRQVLGIDRLARVAHRDRRTAARHAGQDHRDRSGDRGVPACIRQQVTDRPAQH